MARAEEETSNFKQQDHQAAYIFRPQIDGVEGSDRPSKKRRTSSKKKSKLVAQENNDDDDGGEAPAEKLWFVPLLNGTEAPECAQLREKLFMENWKRVEGHAQGILRAANSATLEDVAAFVLDEDSVPRNMIPSAFIITGANIASQDMLFEQLSERLESSARSKFASLRSSDAPNIKAALKKIIQDSTSRASPDDDDVEVAAFGQEGDRKYLNYDLQGLYAFVKAQSCEHVFVTFQDSEAFDSTLLSDLIVLFKSWMPRIPFTLLFGVATSVELLQARLLKSTCQLLYGAQFDVVRTGTILDQIFQPAVAGTDVVLRLGPVLLRSLIERQHDQVASIQAFLSSLKYAHMCHFYANPLSVFAAEDDTMNSELVQSEHLEAFRQLPSFQREVEDAVENGHLDFARSSIENDDFLREMILEIPEKRRQWTVRALRAVSIVRATGVVQESFSQLYLRAMCEGVSLSPDGPGILQNIKRAQPDEFISILENVLVTMFNGDADLGLRGWKSDNKASRDFVTSVEDSLKEARRLVSSAHEKGGVLRGSHNGQGRILRTTVVAQKVQLSHDSAALSEEDKGFAGLVDRVADLLAETIRCEPATGVALHEAWLYDSRTPYRDVFIPRPRATFERSLTRPHDYLACSCCDAGGHGLATTSPATSLLYHLYSEAGNIINVADLWSAFHAMVGDGEEVEEEEEGEADGGARNQRAALVSFYRGLAELKALGFVKPSRRKTDHIAKLKWL